MYKRILATCAVLLTVITGASSVNADELADLKTRVEALEKSRLATLPQTWVNHVQLSGVVEAEAGYVRSDSDSTNASSESDIALATFELGLAIELNDWISAETVLLWEEDDTEPVDLDVAILHLGNRDVTPLYLELGKGYVPFGPCEARHIHCARFCPDNAPPHESSFITDPMTLELAEMRESHIRFGAILGPFDFSMSAFNGDVDEAGDNSIVDNYVISLVYAQQFNDTTSLALGAAYTDAIADSDGITAQLEGTSGARILTDSVAGINVFASVGMGNVGILAEYIGATEHFKAGELFTSNVSRPEAWNFEVSLAITDTITAAMKYETTEDTYDWLPKNRYGAVIGYTVYDGDAGALSVGLEYLRNEFSADDQIDDVITLQVAFEF